MAKTRRTFTRESELSLTGKAARAQDYVCGQAERYERFADEVAEAVMSRPAAGFGWISRPGDSTTADAA